VITIATELRNCSRYKTDIHALNLLLDSKEEKNLEDVKKLVEDIQDIRRRSPEVSYALLGFDAVELRNTQLAHCIAINQDGSPQKTT
jgi:hypothetical protein